MRLSTWRGFCATGLPPITRSPVTQATSGFHGSWTRLSCSGMTSTSGSAGVMSNQAAKPAKPAPDFATSSIALAGTILARIVPNRSTKAIRKYRMPFCLAISLHVGILVPPRVRQSREPPSAASNSALPRNPVRARERNTRHCGRFHRQRDEILGLQIVDVALAAGARDRLRFQSQDREIVGELAAGDNGIQSLREHRILRRDAGGIAPLVPVVIGAGRRPERTVFVFERRIVVAERDERGGPD